MHYAINRTVLAARTSAGEISALDSPSVCAWRFEALPARRRPAAIVLKALHPEKGERWLHSAFDPVEESRKFARAHGIGESSQVFLFGFGAGHVAEAALERLGGDGRLIVVEGNVNLLRAAFEARDLGGLLKDSRVRMRIAAGNGAREILAEVIGAIDEADRAELKVLFHQPSLDLFGWGDPRVESAVAELRNAVDNNERNRERIAKNLEENAERIAADRSAEVLFGRFSGIPAFLVSAGPSLDRNIDLLREVKDRGLVFAADAALAPLLKKGIRPHLVIGVEIREIAAIFYKDIDTEGLTLVWPCGMNPTAREAFKGTGYVYAEEWGQNERLPVVGGGGNVSTAALAATLRLECNPIVFVGLDLCYPTRDSHCRDCVVRREVEPLRGSSWIDGADGGKVPVPLNFRHYHRRIAGMCVRNASRRRFINATEGITAIPGAENRTLEDALAVCFETRERNADVGRLLKEIAETPPEILERAAKDGPAQWWNQSQVVNAFLYREEMARSETRVPYFILPAALLGKRGESVLEVGCDVGAMAHHVDRFNAGFRYTGVDLSWRLVKLGKERIPHHDFLCADAVRLPFRDESHSFVCGFNLLVSCLEWEAILKEMWRVCRTALLITTRFTDAGPTIADAGLSYQMVQGKKWPVIVNNIEEFEKVVSALPGIQKMSARFSEREAPPVGFHHPFATGDNLKHGLYILEREVRSVD